jgi:hypothetical protein
LNEERQRSTRYEDEAKSLTELLSAEREVTAVQKQAAVVLVRDRKNCALKIAKLVAFIDELEAVLRVERAKVARLSSELRKVTYLISVL